MVSMDIVTVQVNEQFNVVKQKKIFINIVIEIL